MTKISNLLNMGKEASFIGMLAVLLMLLAVPAVVADTVNLEQDECPGVMGQTINSGLGDAARAYIVTSQDYGNEQVKTDMKAYRTNPPQYYDSVENTFPCIQDIKGYFNILAALVKGKNMIVNLIVSQITSLINRVCSAVRTAVMNTINNVLDLICIPMPDLGFFSLDLPSVDRKACNGISLRSVMGVRMVPASNLSSRVPAQMLSAPLSRMIEDTGAQNYGYSLRNGRF